MTFTTTDGSGRVSRAVDEINENGETHTATVTTIDADGRVLDILLRVFWRLH